MKQLTVFIGFDPREQDAYAVAEDSLKRRATMDIDVRPIGLEQLNLLADRPIERRDGQLWCPISGAPMSTEFAIARFAVPLLCRTPWAVFMDCDMLVRADIRELLNLRDSRCAVQVVKHKHEAVAGTKMDGQVQTVYARKNWSSVILWNMAHPTNARYSLVKLMAWPGRDLHAFKWLSDHEIGELPGEWNHLIGVNPCNPAAKIAHFTLGIPSMRGYENSEFADEWREALKLAGTPHHTLQNAKL